MMFRGSVRHVQIFTALCVSSFNVLASDGRIELNQAAIEADGGFPYTINQSGSYMLTGSLQVPADTDGLILTANRVSIDLNGFRIAGGNTCFPGNCAQGTGSAIRAFSSAFGFHTSVRNGIMIGFGGNCLQLDDDAHVSDMKVLSCGRNGIVVGEGSIVTRNVVENTGFEGLEFDGDGIYAHNTISQSGLSGGGERTVIGGMATAGNYCDDGNCGRVDTRPRFYLTTGTFNGSQALGACDTGFHMASMWELLEMTQLKYDISRGKTRDDSGFGPPTEEIGWIRTGMNSDTNSPVGLSNCDTWNSNQAGDAGLTVRLDTAWETEPSLIVDPWDPEPFSCNSLLSVWCIED